MRVLLWILVTGLLTIPVIVTAELNDEEKRLSQIIDKNNAEALALLERVVNINSGTMNFDGVRAVGKVFSAELGKLGFQTRWVDGRSFERAGHLIAERGDAGPRLLLIGHLDTVFEKDSPFQRFRPEPDDKAGGPGIADMKGGNVVALYALKALEETGALDRMSIIVIFTGDEERPGDPIDRGREQLIGAARWADFAIAFENGDNNPETAVISRRGNSRWRLTVTARPAHSSQLFREDVGSGAIYEAARVLDAFHKTLAGEEYLTFNPGLILGGTDVDYDSTQSRGSAFGKSNVIAERTVVTGDLRTISPDQLANAKKRMRDIVAASRPHATSQIVFQDRYPPLAPSDGNRRMLALYDRASRDLGFRPVTAVNPMKAGAADVAFTAGHVDMAIDGIGLMGGRDHTVDEFGDLANLSVQTKRAAVLLYRLIDTPKTPR